MNKSLEPGTSATLQVRPKGNTLPPTGFEEWTEKRKTSGQRKHMRNLINIQKVQSTKIYVQEANSKPGTEQLSRRVFRNTRIKIQVNFS